MIDKEWEGPERRKITLDGLQKELIELAIQVKSLHERFDNELGSSKGCEGTVKRHVRRVQEMIEEMKEKYDVILLGDGIGNYGLTSEIKSMKSLKQEVEEHMKAMKWVMGILIPMVMTILIKIFQ